MEITKDYYEHKIKLLNSKCYIGPRNYLYLDISFSDDYCGLKVNDWISMWYDDSQNKWRRDEETHEDIALKVLELWYKSMDKAEDIR